MGWAKVIKKIKRWVGDSGYRKWLFVYCLQDEGGLLQDNDGDVWADNEGVFDMFFSLAKVDAAFEKAKAREDEEELIEIYNTSWR